MAMDPVEVRRLAGFIAGLYETAEKSMVEAVARRVSRGIDTPGWATAKAAETAALRRELNAIVARLEAGIPGNLDTLLDDAYRAGAQASAAAIGTEGAVATSASRRAVQLLAQETLFGLASTHLGILRQTQDAYRATIAEAVAQGVTGTATRRAVAQAALSKFADQGITGFVDTRGRKWQLDTYAEMSTRTALQRAHLAGRFDKLAEHGQDLVKVSDSPDECPLCRPWEGQVLSISGGHETYRSVAEARDAGLFHASCTHAISAYTEGLSKPPPKSTRTTADPEGYKDRQRQRHLEAEVRRWKRRQAAAITGAERAKATGKIAERQAELRALTARTGRRRDYTREAVRTRSAARAAPTPPPAPPRVLTSAEDADEVFAAHAREHWTDDELDAVRGYSQTDYHPMNTRLRRPNDQASLELEFSMTELRDVGIEDLTLGVDERIADLRQALERRSLPETVMLHRGTGPESFGLEFDDMMNGRLGDPSRFVGKVFTEPAFLSTSATREGGFQRHVMLNITAPAGTKGAYIGNGVSSLRYEAEVLLPPGTSFVVTGASSGRYAGADQLVLDVTILP